MISKFLTITALISLFFYSFISAQEIGEIFTVDEANIRYGKVLEKVEISTLTVASWLNSTSEKIMFRLKNNEINALADARELLYSTSQYSETNEVFHMYSKSKLIELIEKGRKAITYFENRKDVFSITNGEYTLESALPCPPNCP